MMNSRDREKKFSSSFLRKIRKPIVERKRRNRINKCLDELKEILLENMKRNGNTQVAKLDKADILEMTVQHLRHAQQQQLSVAIATNASCLNQYRQGFSECAQETLRYMSTSGSYAGLLTTSVNNHLSNIMPRDYENHGNGLCLVKNETSSNDYENRSNGNDYENQSHGLCLVKTECSSPSECETPQRKCRSASPHVTVSKRLQFSPLPRSQLSPLHGNSMGRQISDRMSVSTSNLNSNSHRNSVLTIPPRLPVDADDASPQRNVWRPF